MSRDRARASNARGKSLIHSNCSPRARQVRASWTRTSGSSGAAARSSSQIRMEASNAAMASSAVPISRMIWPTRNWASASSRRSSGSPPPLAEELAVIPQRRLEQLGAEEPRMSTESCALSSVSSLTRVK